MQPRPADRRENSQSECQKVQGRVGEVVPGQASREGCGAVVGSPGVPDWLTELVKSWPRC